MKNKRWVLQLSVMMGFLFFATSMGLAQESPFENGAFWKREDLFLHYRIWYPPIPQGKVLFIHGLGGSTFSWRHAPDFFLQAGYLVVTVDLPGFGYSQRVVGTVHKPENRARLRLEFLRYLDEKVVPEVVSDQRWYLVGHSLGGSTAFLVAMEEPERFQGVALIAPALRNPAGRFFKILTSFPPTRKCWITLIRNFFLAPSRLKKSLQVAYGRKVTAEEFEGYRKPLELSGTARSLLSLVNNAASLKLSSFRGKFHPPFLLIWGEKDRVVPRRQGKRFREIFPDTPLHIIQEAFHCPMETHPKDVYPVILEFFATSTEKGSLPETRESWSDFQEAHRR
jgi:pimeloyl-ACP methyl ester carboxylesterase